jgi:ferritin-like metal-binding protein YciE
MFVRFREQSASRLNVSIIESRRVAGKLVHEHIAALGSIEVPPTIDARIVFWKRMHERLGKLGNRIDPATRARLMGAVHERIPMPTPDGQRTLQRENLTAEERFFDTLHGMYAGDIEGHKALIATAERRIAKAQVEMAKVAEARDAARGQLARLDRGEEVSGGLGRSMTQEDCVRILKAAGRTTSDIRHAMDLAELSRIGGEQAFEDYLQETLRLMMLADDKASKSVARNMLRRLRGDN